MLTYKEGVSPVGLRPEITDILPVVERCYEEQGFPLVITCTTGSHPYADPHTHGFAEDNRTHGIPVDSQERLRDNVQIALGPNYYVKLEDPGGPNEHIHVQYRKDLWRAIVRSEGGNV